VRRRRWHVRDVTVDSGGIASSALNQNDTFSHTFPAARTYRCI
jgi:hypothetical protein